MLNFFAEDLSWNCPYHAIQKLQKRFHSSISLFLPLLNCFKWCGFVREKSPVLENSQPSCSQKGTDHAEVLAVRLLVQQGREAQVTLSAGAQIASEPVMSDLLGASMLSMVLYKSVFHLKTRNMSVLWIELHEVSQHYKFCCSLEIWLLLGWRP